MSLETILRTAEAVSLALTPPTIIGAVAVVWVWLPRCLKRTRNPPAATDWIMLGVTVSFVGACFDNAFWGVAWSDAYFAESGNGPFLFAIGVLFNVPFRQIAGCIAAYAHLRAYCLGAPDDQVSKQVNWLNGWSVAALGIGVAYVVVLECFRTVL